MTDQARVVIERLTFLRTLPPAGDPQFLLTAGIDGALRVAAMLRGDQVAQQIQLAMEYAPEPPFYSGTPKTAAPDTVQAVATQGLALKEARTSTARRIAAKLGIGSSVTRP